MLPQNPTVGGAAPSAILAAQAEFRRRPAGMMAARRGCSGSGSDAAAGSGGHRRGGGSGGQRRGTGAASARRRLRQRGGGTTGGTTGGSDGAGLPRGLRWLPTFAANTRQVAANTLLPDATPPPMLLRRPKSPHGGLHDGTMVGLPEFRPTPMVEGGAAHEV